MGPVQEFSSSEWFPSSPSADPICLLAVRDGAEFHLIPGGGCAESQTLPAAEACGFLTRRGGNRRTGRPREDGPCSTGSHAQCGPSPALPPSASAGPAGTVHKRRLDIGTPCSHHSAQAVPQKAEPGTQLMLNPPRRLLNLPGYFGFRKAFHNCQCQQVALGPGETAD